MVKYIVVEATNKGFIQHSFSTELERDDFIRQKRTPKEKSKGVFV